MTRRLVEQTEAHVVIRLLSLLSGGLLLGGTTGSGGGGGSGSSRGVGIGVSDAVLELINLGPGVVGLDSDGEDLLVGVDDGVDGSRQGGNAGRGTGR